MAPEGYPQNMGGLIPCPDPDIIMPLSHDTLSFCPRRPTVRK